VLLDIKGLYLLDQLSITVARIVKANTSGFNLLINNHYDPAALLLNEPLSL
jgi:hypothetical protein